MDSYLVYVFVIVGMYRGWELTTSYDDDFQLVVGSSLFLFMVLIGSLQYFQLRSAARLREAGFVGLLMFGLMQIAYARGKRRCATP